MLIFADITLAYFPAPQHSHPWNEKVSCLFKEKRYKSRPMFWTNGKILLVSCIEVTEQKYSLNLQYSVCRTPFQSSVLNQQLPSNVHRLKRKQRQTRKQKPGTTNQTASKFLTNLSLTSLLCLCSGLLSTKTTWSGDFTFFFPPIIFTF